MDHNRPTYHATMRRENGSYDRWTVRLWKSWFQVPERAAQHRFIAEYGMTVVGGSEREKLAELLRELAEAVEAGPDKGPASDVQ